MGRKITLEIVKSELAEISPDIEVLDTEYKGSNKPLKCKCKTCNNIWHPSWDNLKQGKGCMECRRKNGNKNRRLDIEEIRRRAIEVSNNLVVLEDEYVNEKTKMRCTCKDCGDEFKISYRSIRNGVGCRKCTKERVFSKLRLSTDAIKEYLIENNIPMKLKSKDYKNAKELLDFECLNCGHTSSKSWSNVRSLKQYCVKCGINKRVEWRKHNIQKTIDLVNREFPHIEILSKESPTSQYKMDCYCNKCDIHFKKTHNDFQTGKGCPKCGVKNRSGENHYKYNPDLTDEERLKTREQLYGKSQSIWRKKVHHKNKWRCAICNSKEKLIAHHLNSFDSHPELRFDVENGVTLCEHHHKDFHSLYGYGKNTKKQFNDYTKHAQ